MPEIQFTDSLKGFDYEVTQTFVCGSRITGEQSKYVNAFVIKNGGKVVLNSYLGDGRFNEAYLKMIAHDEVAWFIENLDLFFFETIGEKKKTCGHLIKAEWGRKDYVQRQQNAARIEIIEIADRCALKMPMHWNKAARKSAWIDIMNGFILDFGICGDGPCPRND